MQRSGAEGEGPRGGALRGTSSSSSTLPPPPPSSSSLPSSSPTAAAVLARRSIIVENDDFAPSVPRSPLTVQRLGSFSQSSGFSLTGATEESSPTSFQLLDGLTCLVIEDASTGIDFEVVLDDMENDDSARLLTAARGCAGTATDCCLHADGGACWKAETAEQTGDSYGYRNDARGATPTPAPPPGRVAGEQRVVTAAAATPAAAAVVRAGAPTRCHSALRRQHSKGRLAAPGQRLLTPSEAVTPMRGGEVSPLALTSGDVERGRRPWSSSGHERRARMISAYDVGNVPIGTAGAAAAARNRSVSRTRPLPFVSP